MPPPEAAPMRADVTQADREAAADLAAQFQRYTYLQVEAPAIQRGEHDDWELVTSFARHRLAHTARPDAGDEVERFWLIIREPGMVPDRKGPFKITDTAKILREFLAANPNAFIDYLTVTPEGEPYVDHGPQVLQVADGRSMSVGRKHNERVKTAALAAMREGVDRGMVEREELAKILCDDKKSRQIALVVGEADYENSRPDVRAYWLAIADAAAAALSRKGG